MDWESDGEQARSFEDCEKYDIANSESARVSTPTHVIVQRQLNDVILSQRAAVERMKNDVSSEGDANATTTAGACDLSTNQELVFKMVFQHLKLNIR